MDDMFLINVKIGGFRMPLRIPRGDEELYRNAEKLVVSYTEEYQRKFNQRSYEEILILVAYQLAVNISRNQLNTDTAPIADKLRELTQELEAILKQE